MELQGELSVTQEDGLAINRGEGACSRWAAKRPPIPVTVEYQGHRDYLIGACCAVEREQAPSPQVFLICQSALLPLAECTFFLLAQFRRQLCAEVLQFEHLANLDLGLSARHRVGATLDPLDGFFSGLHLPQPITGDQLLGFGERAVDHRAFVTGETHAGAFAAGVQADLPMQNITVSVQLRLVSN